MRFFTRQTDTELDAETLEAFASRVRDTYATAPDEAITARQLAAITASARRLADRDPQASVDRSRPEARILGSQNRWRNAMRRNRPFVVAAKLAATAVAAVALMAGLAVAGVTLPAPAQDAFDKAGVDLPNQAAENARQHSGDTSQRVLDVIGQRESFESGCEFGQAVAAAARGEEPTASPCAKAGQGAAGERDGERRGDGATAQGDGEAQSEFGQTTAADAKENARSDGRAFGERTRDRALDRARTKSGQSVGPPSTQDGQSTGQSQSQEGRSIAESHSQGAGGTGESRSQEGRSVAESAPGGQRP